MSVDNFIPAVWAGMILRNLQTALVYGQEGIVNRDYEGDISEAGNTVNINNIGRVTVKNYAKNVDIDPPDVLTGAQTQLLIDQQKYYNFAVDDVDKAQAKPKVMEEATREAAYSLAKEADISIAGLYTGVDAGNVIGSDVVPVVPTALVAYEYLVDLGVLLDQADAPKEGRWAIVPPWYYGMLQKDSRFVHSTAVADMVIRNGEIGEAAGFRILKSNNVPNNAGTKYKIMAGHPSAISYAEQIVETMAFRPERRFSDAMKGLHIYGRKLVRPTQIAVMTANKA